jgi:hypothetical protein
MTKSNNITLTITELKMIVPHIARQKLPIMVRGRHGVGKSEFVYALAADAEVPEVPSEVVELRASQMTEGDLVGLPFRGAAVEINGTKIESTQWNPPDWFLTACSRPVTLFFDEVDRATQEVRQGLFQLNDSRQLNGHKLHPDTVVFACINGGIHGSAYQVQEMDPAELDRYTVYDLEPSVEEWLSWAKGNVYPEIVSFIRANDAFLDYKELTHDPAAVYPSRRSWSRFGSVLSKMLPNGWPEGDAGAAELVFVIGTGFVGTNAAQAFRGFMRDTTRMVDPVAIFCNGDFTGTDGWTTPDWVNLIEKAEHKGMFKIENFANINLNALVGVVKAAPTEVFPLMMNYMLAMNIDFTGSFMTGSYDHPASAEMAEWVFGTLIMGTDSVREAIQAAHEALATEEEA